MRLILQLYPVESISFEPALADAARRLSPEQQAGSPFLLFFAPNATGEATAGNIYLAILDGCHAGPVRALVAEGDIFKGQVSWPCKAQYLASPGAHNKGLVHSSPCQVQGLPYLQGLRQAIGAPVEVDG